MRESESGIDDPLIEPLPEVSSGSSSQESWRRWFPRWFRILIAAVLIASPALVLLFEDVSDRTALSIVASRRFWLMVQSAEDLLIPFVPILAAGWMLAGGSWRWLLFPFLAALTIAEYALAETLVLEATKSLYGSVIEKEWALWGTFYWFAYGFAAILVPWMGFRWTDYWTRSPNPPVSEHPESTTKA